MLDGVFYLGREERLSLNTGPMRQALFCKNELGVTQRSGGIPKALRALLATQSRSSAHAILN